MRTSVVGLVGALLCGCGGADQPRAYWIAINRQALEDLPASCYAGGVVPSTTDKSTNVVDVQQWTTGDAVDGKQFLVVGDFATYDLGDADRVTGLGGLAIAGGPATFSTTLVRELGFRQITANATFTFSEVSRTARGVVTLSTDAKCTWSGPPPPFPVPPECVSLTTCTVSMPFTGRQLEAPEGMVYLPSP